MISARVQEQTNLTDQADFAGDYIIDCTSSGLWRIYEDGTGYSGTSGQTIAKGKVLRDNGMIRNFGTRKEAEAQAWLLTQERQARVRAFKAARQEKSAQPTEESTK